MNDIFMTGVCTAMVTPFINGQINYPMMEMLLRRQINAGIKSVVISGTTGEASTLSDDEKITLFQSCKSYVGNDLVVIAGTGSNSTEHAVYLSKEAEKAGADALLIVSPYYNKATADGLIAHYLSIAHAVKIPIIIYNVPGRTGVDIPVAVYKTLSRIPNIVGVKEATTSITKILQIRAACGDQFTIWAGNDDMTVPIISLGGKGVISVLSNIFPEETVLMTEAALAGDFDTAASLQCKLEPVTQLLFCEVNPIPVKEALLQMGFDCGGYRLPLTEPTKENKKRIQDYFH